MNLAIAIGPEQARSLINTLEAAFEHARVAGEADYTILLLTTDDEIESNQMDSMMEDWTEGEGSLAGLPVPDIIYFGGIWTIALPISLDELNLMHTDGPS